MDYSDDAFEIKNNDFEGETKEIENVQFKEKLFGISNEVYLTPNQTVSFLNSNKRDLNKVTKKKRIIYLSTKLQDAIANFTTEQEIASSIKARFVQQFPST